MKPYHHHHDCDPHHGHHTHCSHHSAHCHPDCHCHGHHHRPLLHHLIKTQFTIASFVTHHAVSYLQHLTSCFPGHQPCEDDMCCTIPEPCWMPKPLGEICDCLCPEEKHQVELTITNEDYKKHSYEISAAGDMASHVLFSESHFELGPKERKTVTATFTAPALDEHCETASYDLVLWVRGCHSHFLRWHLTVSKKPLHHHHHYHHYHHYHCAHPICVDDKNDYVVNWYDHFYCRRDCFYEGRKLG